MRQHSFATRSIRRRSTVETRNSSRTSGQTQVAIQVFVFRGETFLGTELFDAARPLMAGRHHDVALRLDGETVSRYHARITAIGPELFIEDLDSGNGTLVNRDRITGQTRVTNTDQVHIGAYSLRIKLLAAPGPRPFDPSKSEDTTKINLILAAERSNADDASEVELDVAAEAPVYSEALYRDALRRTTGAERADAPANADSRVADPAPRNPTPTSAMDGDSTQMAAEDILQDSGTSPVILAPTDEEELEARLRDLDALIDSLETDGEPRPQSPWANESSAPTTSEVDIEDALFAPSKIAGPANTREFARDLASRLPIQPGVVVSDSSAEIIPLRSEPRAPTPIPQAPLDEDDTATEAEARGTEASGQGTATIEDLDVALLAAIPQEEEEGPETDLLIGGVPPQLAPQVMESSAGASPVRERADGVQDPAASGPTRLPGAAAPTSEVATPRLRGRSAMLDEPLKPRNLSKLSAPDLAPSRRPSEAPAPVPASRVDDAPTRPAPPSAAKLSSPPPLPPRKRKKHAARLMTPTSLQVDVIPMKSGEDSGLVADVFEQEKVSTPPATPPPLPRAPQRRSMTEARPQAKMDGFSSAVGRLPDLPVQAHYDGVEISARVGGQLVDISVLRKAKEEYILGHRTPQGAVAPARAHRGLRLVRINADDTIDLVFPRGVGGHLVRGPTTVTFAELSEGRKYSSLRLENGDIATIILGEGRDAVTYHVRFLSRPKSLLRALRNEPR